MSVIFYLFISDGGFCFYLFIFCQQIHTVLVLVYAKLILSEAGPAFIYTTSTLVFS